MSDGKSSSDDKSQAGGPARATAAVGTAAVGRAVVPGEEAPPASGAPAKPAEGAASNGSASADKPAGGSADAAASKPPVASTPPKPSVPPSGPAKPSEPSITGSLRPSVVNSGQASGSTSVPPVPPPLNSSLRAVSTPTKSAPPVSTPPAAAHPPIATPPTAARPVTPPPGGARPVTPPPGGAQSTAMRPGGTAPSASAGRTSVMGVAGAGSNVGMASAVGTAPGVAAPAAGAATARTQVGEAVRNVRATVAAAASRGPRRARLQLKKIDPWSVMKFSFAASLVLFIVSVVATALLYTVLDAMDVFDSLNKTIGSLTATADQANSGGEEFVITAKLVIGSAALLGAVNMVLFTALATLGAFVYNVCADLVGGIEVTLAERD